MLTILAALAIVTAEPQSVIGPSQAAALAAADIVTVPHEDQFFTRYAYFPEPSDIQVGAFAYALNTGLSHAGTVHRPVVLADGRLLRFDLRKLTPKAADFKRLLDIWENRLAFTEPYTHKPGVVLDRHGKIVLKIFCEPYIANDGKTYHYRTEPIARAEQFALHTGPDLLLVHALTDSNMPLVRGDWLQNVILTTLKVGLTQGVYYDVRGIKGLNQKQVLALYGGDEQDSEELRGDSRAAMLRSGVTDRERRIDVFFGRGVRPTVGLPFITITHDIALADTDAAQDPILNILNFKDAAREAILVLPNGMLLGALFDANGNLQDVVPDQVAHDSTVPSPSPQTLVPIISCLACHGPAEGFLDVRNDVRDMYLARLPDNRKGDIFDDLSSRKGQLDTLDIAASKYGGDLNPPLRIASALHGATTKQLTGFDMKDVCAELVRSRNEFVYGRIDSQRALYELGYQVELQGKTPLERGQFMAKKFAEIIPPLPVNEFGFSPEDGRVLALRTPDSKTINRAKFESIYADLARRAMEAQFSKNEVNQ